MSSLTMQFTKLDCMQLPYKLKTSSPPPALNLSAVSRFSFWLMCQTLISHAQPNLSLFCQRHLMGFVFLWSVVIQQVLWLMMKLAGMYSVIVGEKEIAISVKKKFFNGCFVILMICLFIIVSYKLSFFSRKYPHFSKFLKVEGNRTF